MLQVVTIATTDFLPYTHRLLWSLRSSGSDFHLNIYCDDSRAFACMSDPGCCTVIELPQIRTLGAKRAKFHAYRDAIRSGAFLYLDSDVLVLEPLVHFERLASISACPDDLSACRFIDDKRHPWPGDPDLENRLYINSGVLYFPPSVAPFLERLCTNALRDDLWNRYIIPGGLYDNHFLCAFLNLESQPVELLDETEYNWQGFLMAGCLQVERRGDSLWNLRAGKKLRLVHFAGIHDIDAFVCSLRADVASLLCSRGAPLPGSQSEAMIGFLASLSGHFCDPLPDPFPLQVFDHLLAEVLEIARSRFRRDYSGAPSYLQATDAMRSLVFSTPNSTSLWNDLVCGGACLEGEEYNYLVRLVHACGTRSVVETGAGETSILFHRLGIPAVSVEPEAGPWLDRASQYGCKCFHVPFDRDTLLFNDAALELALDAVGAAQVDLLFIDSPGGTASRSRILGQILQRVKTRYVLFHDAHRDAANLFRYSLEHRLTLVDYLPTARGLVLFSTTPAGNAIAVPRRAADAGFASADFYLEVLTAPAGVIAGAPFLVRVRLTNRRGASLSSHCQHPVFVSYHWFDESGNCLIFDGIRTTLPFDIDPGQSGSFDVRIVAPEADQPRGCELRLCVVQEQVQWFPTAVSRTVRICPAQPR